jgi:hypothetical protein
MNFSRERWVVFREPDNKIFCGNARNYQWKDLNDIGNANICTYMSEKKALAAARASYGYEEDQVRAERVNEMLVSF